MSTGKFLLKIHSKWKIIDFTNLFKHFRGKLIHDKNILFRSVVMKCFSFQSALLPHRT